MENRNENDELGNRSKTSAGPNGGSVAEDGNRLSAAPNVPVAPTHKARKFRFRAWDGDQMRDDFDMNSFGDMFELEEFNPGGCADPECCPQGEDTYRSRPEWILMQYTGLKDRNGKEIYEGDILRTDGVPDVEVFWNIEDGRWSCWYLAKASQDFCELNHSIKYTSEVIGNIYEGIRAKDRSGTPQAGLPAEEYSGEPDGEERAGAPKGPPKKLTPKITDPKPYSIS